MSGTTNDVDNLFTDTLEDILGNGAGDESAGPADGLPDFSDLFDGEPGLGDNGGSSMTATAKFARQKQLEQPPQPYFTDKDYYKNVLTGEGEVAQRVHKLLAAFLNATDPQDKSMHRGRLLPAYWELAGKIAGKTGPAMPLAKRLLLRFGVLLPTMIDPEQRLLLGKIVFTNASGEPVFYVDEWLESVAQGRVTASATDETTVVARTDTQKITGLVEKAQGRFEAQQQVLRNQAAEMQHLEEQLQAQVAALLRHDTRPDYGNVIAPFTDGQKNSYSEISNIMRNLSVANKKLSQFFNEMETIADQLRDAKEKEAEIGVVSAVDSKIVTAELNTVRQMAKLAVGRQGNHFPLLLKQYFRGSLMDIVTRENVINTLCDVEELDPGLFLRTFKQQTNRIVPNIILVPCYGDFGVCWEPFERRNRATSRGRLAIPMYPKDVKQAVIAALGDLRWQVAKEKAQHYWMEEGLTGWYYQWFSDHKMKGDVKDAFVQDYILWLTKESEGTQKLDRDVRDIFWRYVPFPQETKDKLKTRGFVYAELYKKDQNRAMSDGY